MNVGFIGLGAMGLPMARCVIHGGYKTFTGGASLPTNSEPWARNSCPPLERWHEPLT
jgi:3-hydroxyisobutyrate dehydrogenase-like beta-hydroxyacid dehydrogenase